jgi:tRNA(fMet)-specific endonuclease VapC
VYLLDNDVISLVIGPRPPIHLVRKLATIPPDRQFTSAINLGEIVYGAARVGRPELVERARTTVLDLLAILPFDGAAAELYGALRAELEARGQRLAEPDVRIAAVALVHSLTLVTGNARHFSRIPGLTVESWIVPTP